MLTFAAAVALAVGAAASLSAQSAPLPADIDLKSYSRLPLLPREQFDANGQRVFDLVNGKDQATPRIGPAATSMYSVGVAEPMDNLNQYLRKTVVGAHYFEISALIAAREFDQQYEWTGHEAGALRAGVDQKVIDAIKFNRGLEGLPEKDSTVIRFGRELFRQHQVGAALYAKVVELFGRQGMYEIASIMGDYAMAAVMLNAVDQHLPPERQPLLPAK